ncbi:phenylacetate--CoA ligase family protein [Serinicoccus hydrothermalis]|nr:hypothetical protein [Serinicoccus hydrothermalis]
MKVSARQLVFEAKARTVLRKSQKLYMLGVQRETWPVERLRAYQTRKAAEQALYAMRSTRFYRELYESHGFTEQDLQEDPEAFYSLPTVDKQSVRDHFEELKTPDAEDFGVLSVTGGSTGQPLHLLRDKRVSAQPLEWRLFRWWGVKPHDNIALVWRHVKSGRQELLHGVKWWPTRRMQLDAYDINEASVRHFAEQWRVQTPTLLTGYAGGVLEFSRVLEGLDLRLPAPRAVATTASPLTDENRQEVEDRLEAPVFDHYRSAEIPWMGGECAERAGHHIFADDRVVEVLDRDAESGDLGNVVATDLTNKVFPLIRYRIGDRSRAITEPCACGSTLPRIARIVGREGDGLRLPDGTWIAPEGVFPLFSKEPDCVRQFQVVQSADYSILVRVVEGASPRARDFVDETLSSLRHRTHYQVPISWESVDELIHDGGKIRYIRSHVDAH